MHALLRKRLPRHRTLQRRQTSGARQGLGRTRGEVGRVSTSALIASDELVEERTPTVSKQSYAERVSQLVEADQAGLVHLYLARLMTRHLYAATLDPLAANYNWLLPAGLVEPIPHADLLRRRAAAYRLANKQISRWIKLGFAQALRQKSKRGDEKGVALVTYGSREGASASTINRHAETIHLTRDGLRVARAELALGEEDGPDFKALETSTTLVPHQLASAYLYTCLYALHQLGKFELREFHVEHQWDVRGLERRPRSDVLLRLSPVGNEKTVIEVAVEIDRGTQDAKVKNPPPGTKSSTRVEPKLDAYADLVRKTETPLHLAFVVPAHARVSAKTRGKDHAALIARAKAKHADVVGASGKTGRLRFFQSDEPTPEAFALFLAKGLSATQKPQEAK